MVMITARSYKVCSVQSLSKTVVGCFLLLLELAYLPVFYFGL